jgi:hypothetical protein
MLPEQNETQPRFAIRFHEAMLQELPDPYARNAACDEAWEAGNGGMVERDHARDHFDPDKYQEARDVVVFCEHSVPDSKSLDGSTISGTYDQYSLAAMCDNMNGRIRDTDQFSPISKGHTVKGGAEPDLLGFSGAMRLGMIGRENPKFAVLTDEYRRADKLDDFKSLPGRSPEVWKYPNMADRFFAPVAALGTTTPRLDLPPAKYSAIDADGNETPVDRYSRSIDETTFDEVEIDQYMTAMGGANSFAPAFGGGVSGGDQYGSMGSNPGSQPDMSEAGSTEQFLQNVIDGLMQTQPMQWVIQQMQTQGNSGMASPAVQMPVDPVDQLPGQPAAPDAGMGMPPMGGPPMAEDSPPVDGMPPAAEQTPSFPGDPDGDPAQQPPRPEQGMYSMNTDHYAKPHERIETLEAQNQQLHERIAELEGSGRRERYSRELDTLAQTHVFNRDSELDGLCSMSPEAATAQLGRIKENYSRNLTGIEDFNTQRPDGAAAPADSDGDLDEDTAEAVSKYAMEHELDYSTAREQYSRKATVEA